MGTFISFIMSIFKSDSIIERDIVIKEKDPSPPPTLNSNGGFPQVYHRSLFRQKFSKTRKTKTEEKLQHSNKFDPNKSIHSNSNNNNDNEDSSINLSVDPIYQLNEISKENEKKIETMSS